MARTTTRYQIRVRGGLAPQWSTWFEGLTVAITADGETTLTGPIPDQPALHGVLARIRDLGLDLVSVEAIQAESATHAQPEV
jgi:hypothetical protein